MAAGLAWADVEGVDLEAVAAVAAAGEAVGWGRGAAAVQATAEPVAWEGVERQAQ